MICLIFVITAQKAMNGIQKDTKTSDLAHESLGSSGVLENN